MIGIGDVKMGFKGGDLCRVNQLRFGKCSHQIPTPPYFGGL